MARVGRGTIEDAGGRAGWDGVSGDVCGWRRRPPQRLLALLLPQAAGVGVRKALALWARPVHLRADRRGRCEGWREVGRALEGVVGGRGAELKSSHAVALGVCFGICLVSLLLPRPRVRAPVGGGGGLPQMVGVIRLAPVGIVSE